MKQTAPQKLPAEPTKSELEILQVLWQNGPSTVRFVNEELNKVREVNYTSTLKLMQIMLKKEMVVRDDRQMKHIYSAAKPMETTQTNILNTLISNAFGGSTSSLVMRALGSSTTSRRELDKIKELIKKIEEKK